MRKFVSVCFRVFVEILSYLPRNGVRFLGTLLGFLWFDVLKIRKKVILNNLEIAFPEKSQEEKNRIARASVYQMTEGGFESFGIPFFDQEYLNKNFIFHGLEHIQSALEKKKGAFLLGMHMGNGDLAASGIVMKGIPLTIITKRFKTQWVDDLWFSVRGGQGVQFIDAHGRNTAFEILKVLKKNETICFVIDQFMGKPYGIETTFFGKKTGTAYGLALFFLKTKAPIVPVYSYFDKDNKVHISFDPQLKLDHYLTEDKDQTILNLTQYFNNIIEDIVRRYPEYWMWVHKRWKDFE